MIKKFEENGKQLIAVNSVVFSKKDKSEYFLGCGFINGEIRIYSLNDYNWKFSINSNLRSIGPMIVIKNNEIIVGSDDGQINIWKYNDEEDKIILKENLLFEDKMIVGLAYEEETNILMEIKKKEIQINNNLWPLLCVHPPPLTNYHKKIER